MYSLLLVCVLPIQSAHEAAGATGTRRSPRPLWAVVPAARRDDCVGFSIGWLGGSRRALRLCCVGGSGGFGQVARDGITLRRARGTGAFWVRDLIGGPATRACVLWPRWPHRVRRHWCRSGSGRKCARRTCFEAAAGTDPKRLWTWRCPHYPRKRTSGLAFRTSALCQ